jgi:hypothetical protein
MGNMFEGRIGMARRMPVVGEIGMRYGKRNYLRTQKHLLMAKRGKWHLVICPDKCMAGWINVKLHLDQTATKNVFEVGIFNGKASPKADVKLLNENHPSIMAWVLSKVAAYADGKVTLKGEVGTPVVYTKDRRWKILSKG